MIFKQFYCLLVSAIIPVSQQQGIFDRIFGNEDKTSLIVLPTSAISNQNTLNQPKTTFIPPTVTTNPKVISAPTSILTATTIPKPTTSEAVSATESSRQTVTDVSLASNTPIAKQEQSSSFISSMEITAGVVFGIIGILALGTFLHYHVNKEKEQKKKNAISLLPKVQSNEIIKAKEAEPRVAVFEAWTSKPSTTNVQFDMENVEVYSDHRSFVSHQAAISPQAIPVRFTSPIPMNPAPVLTSPINISGAHSENESDQNSRLTSPFAGSSHGHNSSHYGQTPVNYYYNQYPVADYQQGRHLPSETLSEFSELVAYEQPQPGYGYSVTAGYYPIPFPPNGPFGQDYYQYQLNQNNPELYPIDEMQTTNQEQLSQLPYALQMQSSADNFTTLDSQTVLEVEDSAKIQNQVPSEGEGYGVKTTEDLTRNHFVTEEVLSEKSPNSGFEQKRISDMVTDESKGALDENQHPNLTVSVEMKTTSDNPTLEDDTTITKSVETKLRVVVPPRQQSKQINTETCNLSEKS